MAKDNMPDFYYAEFVGGYSVEYSRNATGGRLLIQRSGKTRLDSRWSDKAQADEWDCLRGLAGAALEAATKKESRKKMIYALEGEVSAAIDAEEYDLEGVTAALAVLGALALGD